MFFSSHKESESPFILLLIFDWLNHFHSKEVISTEETSHFVSLVLSPIRWLNSSGCRCGLRNYLRVIVWDSATFDLPNFQKNSDIWIIASDISIQLLRTFHFSFRALRTREILKMVSIDSLFLMDFDIINFLLLNYFYHWF